jgi:hypothetical protein
MGETLAASVALRMAFGSALSTYRRARGGRSGNACGGWLWARRAHPAHKNWCRSGTARVHGALRELPHP